jgi:hypothetical protein
MDELNKILRKYGGLEGLARRIGQGDPLAYRFERADNDNSVASMSWWSRLRSWLNRRGDA